MIVNFFVVCIFSDTSMAFRLTLVLPPSLSEHLISHLSTWLTARCRAELLSLTVR